MGNDIDSSCVSRQMLEMSKQISRRAKPDIVRVARCKNCKDFRQNNENDPYRTNRRGLDDPVPDGFCNYGKPKEASDER